MHLWYWYSTRPRWVSLNYIIMNKSQSSALYELQMEESNGNSLVHTYIHTYGWGPQLSYVKYRTYLTAFPPSIGLGIGKLLYWTTGVFVFSYFRFGTTTTTSYLPALARLFRACQPRSEPTSSQPRWRGLGWSSRVAEASRRGGILENSSGRAEYTCAIASSCPFLCWAPWRLTALIVAYCLSFRSATCPPAQ
jgi:hypothetical protein